MFGSWPRTVNNLMDLFLNEAKQPIHARDIVRIGDTRRVVDSGGSSGPDSGQFPALVFTANPPDPEGTDGLGYPVAIPGASDSGYYGMPYYGAVTQVNYVDLSSAEEMRLTIHNHNSGNFHNYIYVAYVDVAASEQVPENQLDWFLTNGDSVPLGPAPASPWTSAHIPADALRVPVRNPNPMFSRWFEVPEAMRTNVWLAFLITGDGGDAFEISRTEMQVRWPAGGGGSITFNEAAPGDLRNAGGGVYAMDFDVHASNHLMTQTEVRDMVAAILNASGGWDNALIESAPAWETAETAKVIFRVVDTVTPNGADSYGATHYDGISSGVHLVEIDHTVAIGGVSGVSASNIVNREAARAFMHANYDGQGIMADLTGNRPSVPTDADVQDVYDWLHP